MNLYYFALGVLVYAILIGLLDFYWMSLTNFFLRDRTDNGKTKKEKKEEE